MSSRRPAVTSARVLGAATAVALLAGCGASADTPGVAGTGAGATVAATTTAAPTSPGSTSASTAADQSGSTRGSTPGTPPRSTSEVAPAAVPQALRFRAALVGGGELDLAGFAGRPVVMWFWAPY